MQPSGPDFPNAEQMQAWGDVLFLAMRCPRHMHMTATQLRDAFEEPVMLGQYKIFRFDGVPRAMLTLALFGYDAEYRYLAGEAMRPGDWRSGRKLWIADIMAPYGGLAAAVSRWVMTPGNLTRQSFHFRRVSGANKTRKIVHVDFESDGKLGTVLSPAEFGIAA